MSHRVVVVVLAGIALLGAPLTAAGPPAAEPATHPAAAALEAAELAYHRAAAERDREAFAALLGDDAVFFAEALHRGRDAFLAGWAPLWTGKYDFAYRATPLEVFVAASGELGFAIGEVETRYQRPGVAEPEVTAGHYLDVWERTGDGSWRLRAAAPLVVHPRWGQAREPRTGLMTAWPELADRIGDEIAVTWTPETTVRAASGELAYTLGRYRASFGDGAATQAGDGHFLAVWRRQRDGRWQLAGEGLTPPTIHGGG